MSNSVVNEEAIKTKKEYIEREINGKNNYPSPDWGLPKFWGDKKFDEWVSLYNKEISNVCAICLDEMNPTKKEIAHGDYCTHSFHQKCLQWYTVLSGNYIKDPECPHPYEYGIGFAFTKCPMCRSFYSFVGRFHTCGNKNLKNPDEPEYCRKCAIRNIIYGSVSLIRDFAEVIL